LLDPSENGISHLFGPGTDFVEGSCEERHDPGIEQQAAGGAADAPCQKLLVFVPFIEASMLLRMHPEINPGSASNYALSYPLPSPLICGSIRSGP